MTGSISARTIEALTAIATGLHDIADAVRKTGQIDDRIPVFEDDEPGEGQIDVQEPAGEPAAPPEGVGASDTLSARLRALIPATYSDDGYFGVTALEIGEFADEADRLEAHARVVEQSLRTARLEGDGARIKAEQWKARYEETRDANRRVLEVAQWFRGQGQTGYARKVEEAVGGMEGALNADHPLGKVIGVIRECGTEHYKSEEAPAGNLFRLPEDRA